MQEFLKQTHANKELVIVTDAAQERLSETQERHSASNIRWVFVPYSDQLRLGQLRNISLQQARGEFVAQWDDDDLYDPKRLETQFAAILQHQAQGCVLTRWLIWWPEKKRLFVSPGRLWEGSILCRKDKMPTYPNLSKGEDTPVMKRLIADHRVVLLDAPMLYVYAVHGGNTWHEAHFELMYERATLDFSGPFYKPQLARLSNRIRIADYPMASSALASSLSNQV